MFPAGGFPFKNPLLLDYCQSRLRVNFSVSRHRISHILKTLWGKNCCDLARGNSPMGETIVIPRAQNLSSFSSEVQRHGPVPPANASPDLAASDAPADLEPDAFGDDLAPASARRQLFRRLQAPASGFVLGRPRAT